MKKNGSIVIAIALLFSITGCKRKTESLKATSPDHKIEVTFLLNESGQSGYSVAYNGIELIKPSLLGFQFGNMPELRTGLEVVSVDEIEINENWELPWGEKRLVNNHYNQVRVGLVEKESPNRKFNLVFKVYNDGIAFRYEFPKQDSLTEALILEENTEFKLAGNHKTFWQPGDWDIYEHLYNTTKFSEINATKFRNHDALAQTFIPHNAINTPVTMITPKGVHLSFHEANLTNYSSMTLLVDTVNYAFKSCLVGSENHPYKVKVEAPFNTPWRMVNISPDAKGLLESSLVLNLNEPNKLGDVSWVTTTKYVGIWWDMHLGTRSWDFSNTQAMGRTDKMKPHGRHGATTAYAKELIDFAAEHNIDGLLVEGWNTGWEHWIGFEDREGVFDFVTPYADYDLGEVVRYGKSKGVELIMHHETSAATQTYTQQMDTAFKLMNSLGIHKVKTGYVGKILPKGEYHQGQYMVNHYHSVIETAAKYQIAVNAHEGIKATGKRRTYPNEIARETFRGQEFNAWSPDGGNPPEHLTLLAFTAMMAGPMDYTPGIFDIKLKPYREKNQVNTTLAHQLALYVVINSPIQMAADLIVNYKNHPAFKFIEDVPTNWEQTLALNAEVGDFVTIARQDRASKNWFIGAITDENARDLEISLNFLPTKTKYKATIYKDAPDAHWNLNPTAYLIETVEVDSTTVLTLKLVPGGGAAISLIQINQ